MSGTGMGELLDKTERNLVEIHWRSLREGPGPHRQEWPGATAVGSALPTEATNTLFILSPPADLRQLLRDARVFFRRAPAWRVSAPGTLHDVIAPIAIAEGLRPAPSVPRMILTPIPPAPPVPAGLTIRSVATRAELLDFCTAAGRAHRIPAWYLRLAFPRALSGSESREPRIRFFVGYVEGRPVATAGHATSEGVIGIFFVGTVPEARRKGYGEALTWAAIRDGQRLGADVAWLQSTPMGRPLYERMGFRWVLDDYDWVAPASGLGHLRVLFRLLRLTVLPPRRPAATA